MLFVDFGTHYHDFILFSMPIKKKKVLPTLVGCSLNIQQGSCAMLCEFRISEMFLVTEGGGFTCVSVT